MIDTHDYSEPYVHKEHPTFFLGGKNSLFMFFNWSMTGHFQGSRAHCLSNYDFTEFAPFGYMVVSRVDFCARGRRHRLDD